MQITQIFGRTSFLKQKGHFDLTHPSVHFEPRFPIVRNKHNLNYAQNRFNIEAKLSLQFQRLHFNRFSFCFKQGLIFVVLTNLT